MAKERSEEAKPDEAKPDDKKAGSTGELAPPEPSARDAAIKFQRRRIMCPSCARPRGEVIKTTGKQSSCHCQNCAHKWTAVLVEPDTLARIVRDLVVALKKGPAVKVAGFAEPVLVWTASTARDFIAEAERELGTISPIDNRTVTLNNPSGG